MARPRIRTQGPAQQYASVPPAARRGFPVGVVLFLGSLGAFFLVMWERLPLPDELRLAVIFFLGAGWTLFFGIDSLRTARLVEDKPTARVATAPQGYVELIGRAMGKPEPCPIGGETCVWVEAYVSRKPPIGKAKGVAHHARHEAIELHDSSGVCHIHPGSGDVVTEDLVWYGDEPAPSHVPNARWRALTRVLGPVHAGLTPGFIPVLFLMEFFFDAGAASLIFLVMLFILGVSVGRYRYQLRRIRPGDALYALGSLATVNDVHTLSADADGRPFIVSTLPQHAVARRSRRAALPWFAAFVTFLGLLGWVLSVYTQRVE